MGFGDALLFFLLAIGDVALMICLRRARRRRLSSERVSRSLRMIVGRQNSGLAMPLAQRWSSRRAS